MILQHLIVEDGEVQGETQLDGVAGCQIDSIGLFICLFSSTLRLLQLIAFRVLCHVAVVICDHLDEEGLRLAFDCFLAEYILVDDFDDLSAVVLQLALNLVLVGLEGIVELRVLRVLLDGSDGATGRSLARDQIFEGHREKVSLVRVHGGTL